MSKLGTLWIIVCSVTVVLANVALKSSMDRTGVKLFSGGLGGVAEEVAALSREPTFYMALACYAFAMLIWFRLVATEPLSVAYPALVAMTFVGVTLASMLLLHEPAVPRRIAGLVVIIAGLALVSGG
jgi:multidrug transporter EmrE-like cation transporter